MRWANFRYNDGAPFTDDSASATLSTLRYGLRAFWNFDAGASSDLVSNTGGITLTKGGSGAVTYSASDGIVGGMFWKADTISAYMYHNADTLANLTAYTYSGWYKFPSFATGYGSARYFNLLGSQDGAGNWRARILGYIGAGSSTYAVSCFYTDAVGADDFSIKSYDFSGGVVEVEDWHMAVMRFDGATLKCDLITTGGQYTGSEAVSTSLPTIVNNKFYAWYPPQNMGGVAQGDAFGVWDRALTDAEVLLLWNSGSGKQWSFL